MAYQTINTDAGNLDLIAATNDQLFGIANYWPMELVVIPDNSNLFGLVFQHGTQEVWGIKMQPTDLPESEAEFNHAIQRSLVAAALPYYIQKKHSGLIIPCPYYKEKSAGFAEAGIAFFLGPDTSSKAKSKKTPVAIWEQTLGEGASAMIYDMAEAISQAMTNFGISEKRIYIGMDLRPRLMIGSLAMHFAVQGQEIIVIKHPLDDTEPIWETVVRSGFSSLLYAPMFPVSLPDKYDTNVN
jgi:hypothetical protein